MIHTVTISPNQTMHPDFRTSNLSELPLTSRRVALLAVDATASPHVVIDRLLKIRAMIDRTPDSAFARKFLPVIWAILDSRLIPDPDIPTVVQPRVVAAVLAMELLAECGVLAPAIKSALWPRIWRWSQFIQYHAASSFHGEQQMALYKLLSHFQIFIFEPTTAQLVRRTPDVCVFVARAMNSLVDLCEQNEGEIRNIIHHKTIHAILLFLTPPDEFPAQLEELVEGAGGDMVDLAHLLVRYLAVLVRGLGDKPDEAVRNRLFHSFLNAHGFIHTHLLRVTDDNPALLWQPLASAQYIPVITEILCRLIDAGPCPLRRNAVVNCIRQVGLFLPAAGTCQVVVALKAGLLRALVSCTATLVDDKDVSEPVALLLDTVMLPSTLQHDCMSALSAALAHAQDTARTPAFVASPCFARWNNLRAWTRRRLVYFEEFDSTRSCINLACDTLLVEKNKLKRCSACRLHLYCSPECQAACWSSPGHRAACQQSQERLPTSRALERTDRFHDYVISREYQSQRLNILLKKLAYIHRNGDTDFCVVMEYEHGAMCTPRVAPIAEWNAIARTNGLQQRANDPAIQSAVEAKRVEKHVLRTLHTDMVESAWILRSNASWMDEALTDMARQIPPGVDVLQLEMVNSRLFRQIQTLASLPALETYVHL
ncbi:hypothetical protein C8R47DRAFT_1329510 [Mycena vitilis]|nr:hypothetical protein C8R47DRAFT_1329510 [Mycena vitilis]